MRILFVHCNYPAQFRHLSRHFAEADSNEVVFLCQSKEWTAVENPRVRLQKYQLGRDPQGEHCHPYLRRFESAVLHGQAALREAMKLRQQGFVPDLIIGHSGFGNTLYLKEVWPDARFVGYFEWFYRSRGADVGFGKADQTPSPDTSLRVHTYNGPILMDLALTDGAICPTHWQASQFPSAVRGQMQVVFDGIDTDVVRVATRVERNAEFSIDGFSIDENVPLVTYVTRCFEPYRGWPQVAEGLSLLMQRNPRVHVLLVGSDDVAYGGKRGDGKSWRNWALEEWPMDQSRVHCLPALGYEDYLRVLRRSWVHVYWTVPFILSWSLMESLATGCSIVASNTQPLQEVVKSGDQAILVDFFDSEALAQQVDALLDDPLRRTDLGTKGRNRIFEAGYDLKTCLNKQIEVIESALEGC